MLIAAGAAGWVGFSFDLPLAVHLPSPSSRGLAGGALWGGIVGLLKARTGAHEVILTIMLNYIAFYLLVVRAAHPGLLQAPGSTEPEVAARRCRAPCCPTLFGPRYNLNWGFMLVIAITASSGGCSTARRSASGSGRSARTRTPRGRPASNVKNIYLYAMLISGALVGLAGVHPGARHAHDRLHLGHRRRHRLRRHHGRAARPLAPLGHVRRRHPLRRPQGRRLRHAGGRTASRSTSCSSSSR